MVSSRAHREAAQGIRVRWGQIEDEPLGNFKPEERITMLRKDMGYVKGLMWCAANAAEELGSL